MCIPREPPIIKVMLLVDIDKLSNFLEKFSEVYSFPVKSNANIYVSLGKCLIMLLDSFSFILSAIVSFILSGIFSSGS